MLCCILGGDVARSGKFRCPIVRTGNVCIDTFAEEWYGEKGPIEKAVLARGVPVGGDRIGDRADENLVGYVDVRFACRSENCDSGSELALEGLIEGLRFMGLGRITSCAVANNCEQVLG